MDVAKEAVRALACSGGPNMSVSLHRNDTRSLLSYHLRRLQLLKEQQAQQVIASRWGNIVETDRGAGFRHFYGPARKSRICGMLELGGHNACF